MELENRRINTEQEPKKVVVIGTTEVDTTLPRKRGRINK